MHEKDILGVRINFGFTKETFIQKVKHYVDSGIMGYICTVNPEFIMDAQDDPEFKEILNSSLINIPDGVGVLMAEDFLSKAETKEDKSILSKISMGIKSGFCRKYSEERITGADSIYDICALCEKEGYSVFLLGGWEKDFFGKSKKEHGNVSGKAAEKLLELYPNLNIVGYTSEFRRDPIDDDKTVDFIKSKMREKSVQHIDVIFVAYNHKHQEKWLNRNMKKIPATIGLGVGGTLDFISGARRRAPNVFTKLQLEWLYRLITEPWRFSRIFKAFPAFPLKVFISSLHKK